jgi:hypothetical protein
MVGCDLLRRFCLCPTGVRDGFPGRRPSGSRGHRAASLRARGGCTDVPSGDQLGWTADLSSDYTIPLGAGKLNFALGASYSSSYVPYSDSFDPTSGALLFKQGAYALTNGSVTWTGPNDHLWASIYSNNMFNRRYRIFYNYSVFGAYDVHNQPVTYGVRVGYNY